MGLARVFASDVGMKQAVIVVNFDIGRKPQPQDQNTKRVARGFRNFAHYRARLLLNHGRIHRNAYWGARGEGWSVSHKKIQRLWRKEGLRGRSATAANG